MTTGSVPRTSLIITSRHRPDALARCLLAVAQLDHPDFELIVVTDPAGLAQAQGLAVKRVAFDVANISAARNAGLAVAAGQVVAFLDDDAVPEPSWLSHLTRPFAAPEVAAAGGAVRGPDGIGYQWRAGLTDAWAEITPLPLAGLAPSLPTAPPGRAVATMGTNCAFRRDLLAGLGGFDPAYRYFLDETDVNWRLAAAGHTTAIVPMAQVHHRLAASALRRADRVPCSLHDIGASTVVFWRRHAGGPAAAALARLRTRERARLVRHMLAARLEPRDVARLMRTLEDGLAEGALRPLAKLAPIGPPTLPFLRFPAGPRPGRVLAGRPWQAQRLRARAAAALAAGEIVTLFLFSPDARPHQMCFTDAGIWEQTGGLWGRAGPGGPRLHPGSFAARLARETERLAGLRPM